MIHNQELYAFVFSAQLAQVAVDERAPRRLSDSKEDIERVSKKMPLDVLDIDLVNSAKKMSSVYTAIAAFENSARKFIQDRLIETIGADWWKKAVPKPIQESSEKRKIDEDQIRWHGTRGSSMIFYAQMGDLVSILRNNATAFENHIESIEWAQQIFKSLERSRNVIMHGGELSMNDIERVSMNIRDWIRQVGG